MRLTMSPVSCYGSIGAAAAGAVGSLNRIVGQTLCNLISPTEGAGTGIVAGNLG